MEKDDNKKDLNFSPTHIPEEKVAAYLILSVVLLLVGTFCLSNDFIPFLGSRGREDVYFHGVPAWIAYIAMLFGVANILSVVVDYFDKRNNETNYYKFAKYTEIIGWCLLFLSIILEVFVFQQATKSAYH